MSSARKVKFVEVDTSRGGLPVKRKQVQHACASCRRRKRRCIHADDFVEDTTPDQVQGRHISPIQPSPATASTASGRDSNSLPPIAANGVASIESLNQSVENEVSLETSPSLKVRSSRFVGDLNPEGMFREATGSASTRETSQKGDVGVWLSSTGTGSAAGQSSQFITSRPPPIMDRFLLPFVKEHCLTCLSPEDDFVRLKAIFLQKIHPIFPVVPIHLLDGDIKDPITIVLRQLVSLAAGTDPDASQYLRLTNKGPEIQSPQDFSQALSSSLRASLETSVIPDRLMHIRALTILSLYTQPTCAEEADLPAQLGGKAIQHVQTLGLHLLRYEAANSDELENLFCAVWALDRLNGAVYARPYLLHERDIGVNLDACIKRRPPCFRLFLLVTQWLDQVVELYRPGPSAEASGKQQIAYIDLPVLEAMIVDAEALKVPSSLIATIETFYHAVIILSCRLHRPGTLPAASTLPPPSANARRSLAAERIACSVPRDCLSPVPFIPYAVSLALSVEYRKMRHSRLPMFRARAMTAFRRNCQMLRNFGDYFWSAKVVAELGERVLKEMERAATSLTKDVDIQDPAFPSKPSSGGSYGRSGRRTSGEPQSYPYNNASNTMDVAAGMDNFVDFSAIDAVSGQDLFSHIDPNFDLNAVEDALEANLDINLPLNWGDWEQFTA